LAACSTLIVLVIFNALLVIVMVADRCAPVFALAFNLNEPLPVLFVGVMFEMVNHDLLLVGTFHVVLDVT